MLSRRGFNVAATARNAKGADILIYNDRCDSMKAIQVKNTTDRYAVNAGKTEADAQAPQLICDYWIFVDLSYEIPKCFIFTRDEAQNLLERDGKPGRDVWKKNRLFQTSFTNISPMRITYSRTRRCAIRRVIF